MFGGGRDPFMQMFGEMHRSMHEMDQMMNQMMDPFGAFGMPPRPSPFMAASALEDVPRSHGHVAPHQMHQMMMRDPFGFGGFPDIFAHRRQMPLFAIPELYREMNGMAEAAMNDPNGLCYSSSTMISMDGSGRPPRVVETSTRRSGDVKETRRRVQNGDEEEMVIGHSIGEREHVLEKKRDKDGNVRNQQKFRNLDQAEAEAFDREFQTRAERNVRNSGFGDLFGYRSGGRSAIDGRSGTSRPREISSSRDNNGPIITLPDEDESPRRSRPSASSSSYSPSGPIIREISEEEAEQSVPKRRKDIFGRYRVGDN